MPPRETVSVQIGLFDGFVDKVTVQSLVSKLILTFFRILNFFQKKIGL